MYISNLGISVVCCVFICYAPYVTSQPGELLRRFFFGNKGNRSGDERPLRVVDLSHPLDSRTLFWPGFPNFNISHLAFGNQAGGFWLEANWISSSEHGGTHVDVPAHFFQGGQHLHELPVDRFIGPGVLVDAGRRATEDADFELGVEDLQAWERKHGQIPQQSVVLISFGWSSRWPDRNQYFNTRTPQDIYSFHFPGVSLEALQWLVQQRDVKLIDVPSVDRGQDPSFQGHRYLCANGVPFVESLANLDQLPVQGMTFFAVPLRVVGGSGCPVRAFAVVSGSANMASESLVVMFLAMIVMFFSLDRIRN